MSWKRIVYPLFVAFVACISALTGVMVGGITVYQTLHQGHNGIIPTTSQVTNASPISNIEKQTLSINTTQIETTITQSAQNIGPSVVTVVGSIPGQVTFFGRTSDATVSGSGVFISQRGGTS